MIEHRKGDLLVQDDIEVIIHQCNCFNTMGAGIARQIAARWPEVMDADNRTRKGDMSKLGSYTSCVVDEGMPNEKTIINLYGQYRYGRGRRYTDYTAVELGLQEFIDDYGNHFTLTGEQLMVGIPFRMGCVNGGGDWNVVMDILIELFGPDWRFRLVICEI
jgi:hypothetical protein